MNTQQVVVEKDGLHVILEPKPNSAKYATHTGEKGNKYFVDAQGSPIPSLRMQDKVWNGEDYRVYNPNDSFEEKSKKLWTLKWAWIDRPRVIKWLCPPRIEPWYNKPDSFGISGIRGGGKSSLLVAILAAYHARGGSIIDSYQCYDEETEVLTNRGWIRFADLNDDDCVATVDQEGFLEYQKPEERQIYAYDGDLVSIGGGMEEKRNNSLYDLLVTPNHRLILNDSKSKRIVLTAGELLEKKSKTKSHHLKYHVVNSLRWKGKDCHDVEIPIVGKADKITTVKMEPFLRFLGWYLSEGSMRKIGNLTKEWYTWRLTIAEPKEKNRPDIRGCIQEMGFAYDENKNEVWVNSIQLGEMFRELGHVSEKFIFEWVKNLPPQRLEIILDSMMKGGGTRWNGKRGRYTSVSKRLAEDVSEIALKCGFRVIMSSESPSETKLKDGRIIKGNYTVIHVNMSKTHVNNSIKTSTICTKRYKGNVYDVTVPNHTLVVRRKGRVVISSNSNDNESLCWLTSPWKKNVVLIHGEGVEFKFANDTYGTMSAKDVDARHLPSGKIFIITKMGFGSEVLYYDFLNALAEQATHRDSWDTKKIDIWGIREAQEFVGSKLRSSQASNAKTAQDAFVRFHTQALHCYGQETEVLTQRGWITFAKVSKFDEVLSLNPETGFMEYVKPVKKIEQIYSGKMIKVEEPGLNFRVTDRHMMYAVRDDGLPYEFVEAISLTNGRWGFKTDGSFWWKGSSSDYPHRTNNSIVWVEPENVKVENVTNEKVYCLTLPKYHTMYVRRNKLPFWCGNCGYAIAYDRPRYTGADKDIRELTTWQLFKAQGAQDWPRQLNWYFKFITPRFLRHMPRNMGLMAGENGGLGIINFGFPFWLWNTKQGFSITEKLGISPAYDAEKIRELVAAVMQEGAASGHKKIMTEEMHEQIVNLHIGDGTVENPHGVSLKDLAITTHISLPTVSKAWRSHVLGECGCRILTAQINAGALGPAPTAYKDDDSGTVEE